MHNIVLVCTAHTETGKCNSDELHKIIESLGPDVIFEELSSDLFDKFYKTNQFPEGTYWILAMCIQVLYFTLMESSKTQATVGKMAMGIIVTDTNGAKLDFAKAFVRNLCRLLSNLTLLIGYIIAAFTEKHQALHDIIAGTLVVKKPAAVQA